MKASQRAQEFEPLKVGQGAVSCLHLPQICAMKTIPIHWFLWLETKFGCRKSNLYFENYLLVWVDNLTLAARWVGLILSYVMNNIKKRKIGTVGNPSLLSEYARRVSKEILKEYLSVVVSLCEVLVCLRMCLRVCMARQK